MSGVLPTGSPIANVLAIAEKMREKTPPSGDLSSLWIKNFADSEQCFVEKKDTSWLSRFFEVACSFFQKKKIVPYNLRDNLIYLNDMLSKCSIPEKIELDQEIKLLSSLTYFIEKISKIAKKKPGKEFPVLIENIRRSAAPTLIKLKEDIDTKTSDIERKNTETKLYKEFSTKLQSAKNAFKLKGSDLENEIQNLRSYKCPASSMQKQLDSYLDALEIHKKMLDLEKKSTTLKNIKVEKPSIQDLQSLQEKTARLIEELRSCRVGLEKYSRQLKYSTESSPESDLKQSCDDLIKQTFLQAEDVETVGRKSRLDLYLKNNFEYIDSVNEKIKNASSFTDLCLLTEIVKAEAKHVRANCENNKIVGQMQKQIDGSTSTLVQTAISLSEKKRQEITGILKIINYQKPDQNEFITYCATLIEYKSAIFLLDKWTKNNLDKTLCKKLSDEIHSANELIDQTERILSKIEVRKTKESPKADKEPQQIHGNVTGASGGVTTGHLVVQSGATVNITNITQSSNDLLSQVTKAATAAAELNLIGFSDISSLLNIAESSTTQNYATTALFGLPQVALSTCGIMTAGFTLVPAVALAATGVFVVPYVVNKIMPQKYAQLTPQVTALTQVLYFQFAPGMIASGSQQLTSYFSPAPAATQPVPPQTPQVKVKQDTTAIPSQQPVQPAPIKVEMPPKATINQNVTEVKTTPVQQTVKSEPKVEKPPEAKIEEPGMYQQHVETLEQNSPLQLLRRVADVLPVPTVASFVSIAAWGMPMFNALRRGGIRGQ